MGFGAGFWGRKNGFGTIWIALALLAVAGPALAAAPQQARNAGARWLVEHQHADGGWGAGSWGRSSAGSTSDVATTSLAVMALLRDALECLNLPARAPPLEDATATPQTPEWLEDGEFFHETPAYDEA
jgi:hypothetical protein